MNKKLDDKKVVVGMSGGIDSSVAALLLKQQGYEVIGVTLKHLPDELSENPGKTCCSLDDINDARYTCYTLGIPHYVLNVVEEFKKDVMDYFIKMYNAGKTPSPCVICDEKVKINPILFGGGQQGGLRSGTLNIPGIAGMGLAAKMVYQDFPKKIEKLYELKDYFIAELEKLPEVKVNSEKGKASAPQIVSASFYGIKAEVLLHALEEKGIYVSSGSACSSNHPGISGTLKAIGLTDKELDSTLRFSFSFFTEKYELTDTIDALKELLPMLRKFYKA